MKRTTFSLLCAALAAAWLPASRVAAQAPTAAPTRILFVGNSFFHGKWAPVLNYNSDHVKDENFGLAPTDPRFENHPEEPGPWSGIPGIFQKLTQEAGLNYEVHLEAISGKTLKYHYENALPVIQQAQWQAVVLQDNSAWPLPERRKGHAPVFREYAGKLEQAIHGANPQARVYLYQTWARADFTYPETGAYHGLPVDSMTADLHRAYYGLARQNGRIRGVAPAGDAWLRAIQQGVALRNPYQPETGKINLWGPDNYHPSAWGSYLNALVLFGEITGHDPRRFGAAEQAAAALGISPPDAVSLQRVAYEQVKAARPEAFAEAEAKAAKGKKAAPAKVKVKRKSS